MTSTILYLQKILIFVFVSTSRDLNIWMLNVRFLSRIAL
jgi:hypothetical protein